MILAQPRGFCAGVERAISIVEEAIRIYGPPVFVRHEIVHNKRVVDELKNKGAIFVDEVSDIPDGGVTIFSAHGISEKVENQARLRSLPVIDATCPLVSKVHKEGQHHATKNRDVILIGHASHPEVEGTMGRIKGGVHLVTNIEDVKNLQVRDENKVAYVTQTTLSVDDTREIIAELKEKFPNIIGPDVGAFRDLKNEQLIKTFKNYSDLINCLEMNNSEFDYNKLNEKNINNNFYFNI